MQPLSDPSRIAFEMLAVGQVAQFANLVIISDYLKI